MTIKDRTTTSPARASAARRSISARRFRRRTRCTSSCCASATTAFSTARASAARSRRAWRRSCAVSTPRTKNAATTSATVWPAPPSSNDVDNGGRIGGEEPAFAVNATTAAANVNAVVLGRAWPRSEVQGSSRCCPRWSTRRCKRSGLPCRERQSLERFRRRAAEAVVARKPCRARLLDAPLRTEAGSSDESSGRVVAVADARSSSAAK